MHFQRQSGAVRRLLQLTEDTVGAGLDDHETLRAPTGDLCILVVLGFLGELRHPGQVSIGLEALELEQRGCELITTDHNQVSQALCSFLARRRWQPSHQQRTGFQQRAQGRRHLNGRTQAAQNFVGE